MKINIFTFFELKTTFSIFQKLEKNLPKFYRTNIFLIKKDLVNIDFWHWLTIKLKHQNASSACVKVLHKYKIPEIQEI